jgi:hypothetical protein
MGMADQQFYAGAVSVGTAKQLVDCDEQLHTVKHRRGDEVTTGTTRRVYRILYALLAAPSFAVLIGWQFFACSARGLVK